MTYLIAVFTWAACDLHTTKTSCTPARARLSKVQSKRGALHMGSRHCAPCQRQRCALWRGSSYSWFPRCKRAETFVEAVRKNDGLQDLILVVEKLVLAAVRVTARHDGSECVQSKALFKL